MNVILTAVLLTISLKAGAFATHDMPKRPSPKEAPNARVARDYGAPVKRDLSHNRCVQKGRSEYKLVLFYEEFDTLAECLAANKRG